MVATGIVFLIVGLILFVISFLLFRGHINILHDYHYNNVKEEDKKIFGRLTGGSLFIGSLGLLGAGILSLIFQDESLVPLFVAIEMGSLVVSIILVLIVIKKYNGKIIG